ncbi:MAG: sigma 54-interacting transcriptional regulator, partial [Myxococcota bacterium]
MSGELLLVEDRCRTREKIGAELRALGYGVTTARDGSEALAILRTQRVDVVLSDYRMSPMDGLSLLRSVRRTLDLPFILYSSGADAEAVFQAGRDGAFYFLEYPFRIEEQLLPTIEESLSHQQEPAPEDRLGADRIVGCSLEAHRVRSLVRRVARSRATVLVTGETGTGKEVVARAIHDESERGPFVAVAVTELAESLLDSELFGHERGAFTGATQRRRGLFAAATRGTLFLDEIG